MFESYMQYQLPWKDAVNFATTHLIRQACPSAYVQMPFKPATLVEQWWHLGQGEDGNLMLSIIGKILVKV